MRWILLLLLLAPVVHAFDLADTGLHGKNLDLYSDFLVYENAGNVFAYDLIKKKELFSAEGASPAIFADIIVFEQKVDGKKQISYSDIRKPDVSSTNISGSNPDVYSYTLVFSANEVNLGVDYSGDAELDDDIILKYNIEEKRLENLRTAGFNPVLTKEKAVFLSSEKSVKKGIDLNADGDLNDNIVRIFDLEARKTDSSLLPAEKVSADGDKAVFSSQGELVVLDLKSHKAAHLGIKGINPSISNDRIAFQSGDDILVYDLDKEFLAKVASGKEPVLFHDRLVFRDDKSRIYFFYEGDFDQDGLSDFEDNCPELEGEQPDSDFDGVGDGCEKVFKKSVPVVETEKPLPEESSRVWPWLLLAVVLLPFVVKYGYRYYKKCQKSFGF